MSDSKEKFPFSDEELIGFCRNAVKERCKAMKPTGEFDLKECLETAREELKKQYRIGRKYSRYAPLKVEHSVEMGVIYKRVWPSIEKMARETTLMYAMKKKSLDITKITAESCIREALKEAGIKVNYIICQCYRAKVNVRLPGSNYKLTIIIRYRDIREGRLDYIIDEFKRFVKSLSELPFEVRVSK